ncbi:BTAD domain-containing putative transcriptional regulator [Crossiella cryophila]|uniref:Putative ATPase/DNA-binding SARP family transcriptional activator n=1 Tax=Crossiella cryophila TaxID=43355 RepID=A0A7W7FV66_9PSEU|nr:BTAD domain-containing putative transcriptional regulator [Crossiella cryophila]MBB4678710.1 putative ATPase/DNA-binding SARP family transcriptional activator [Crossiella cryophila]
MLTCHVLGHTEVTCDGLPVQLGGPVPRRLLTALIAARGDVLSYPALATAVWGEPGPARATATLQVYVSRLRGLLGPADRHRLARGHGGYQLIIPPEWTDVARFEAGLARARRLLPTDPAAALPAVEQALRLWRGRPYLDLPGAELIEAETSRLVELHQVALETRAAARLAGGDAAGAVPELDLLITETPYRESRWALLVLALYRGGRQADALAALRRARTVLAEDLGIDPGPELRDLEHQVLAQDPHLLQPTTPPRQALVTPLTSFTGRDTELADLGTRLRAHRLVTLTGPAGVGKTRLALEHANRVRDTDGPWLVRLADLADGTLLLGTVATATGISGADPDTVLAGLATRTGTLVLDNCEHLTDPVAEFAIRLLNTCPGLRLLITSREQLGLDGEQVIPVRPLAIRLPDGTPGPAVALLTDRVQAVHPGWQPSPAEADDLEALCTALDGLPLALELAAARSRILGPREILDRLDDRFTLLGEVPRGSLTPHRTLRAAIEWSVHLLSDADRAFLHRLWPFDGGFTYTAAAAVHQPEPLAALSSLVAKSVLSADTTGNPTRYRLLESVREYCREHDPAPARSAAAHAHWVRTLVAASAEDLNFPHDGQIIRSLTTELPNLRAGIRHDITHDPVQALRTIGLLGWFWIRGGHFAEAAALLDAARTAAPDAPALDRARALIVRGDLLGFSGAGLLSAEVPYLEAIALAATGDTPEHRALRGRAHYQAAFGAIALADPARATHHAEAALALGESVTEPWLTAGARMAHGAALVLSGQSAAGESELAEAAELARRHNLPWLEGWATHHLGQALLLRARTTPHLATAALTALRTALDRYLRTEDISFTLIVLTTLATALHQFGAPGQGAEVLAAVHRERLRHGIQPEAILAGATSLSGREFLPAAIAGE